jgi:hypothetical protein
MRVFCSSHNAYIAIVLIGRGPNPCTPWRARLASYRWYAVSICLMIDTGLFINDECLMNPM